MGQAIIVAAIAGLASALLSGILTPGSVSLVMFVFLAPLPLFIAGLGWHPYVAALGGLLAALAINVTLGTRPSIAFVGTIGLPTFVLCWLADRLYGGRTGISLHPGIDLGKLAVVTVFGIALIVVGTTIFIEPDFQIFQQRLRVMVEQIVGAMLRTPGQTVPPAQQAVIVDMMVRLMLPLSGALVIATLTISGTIGLQIAERAKRLAWQKPDFRAFRLPGGTMILFGMSLAVALVDGYVGVFAEIMLLGLAMMYMLQGLAVLHVRSIGKPGRGLIISAAWASIVVLGLPALIFVAVGLADHILDFRRSQGGPA